MMNKPLSSCPTCGQIAAPGTVEGHANGCPEAFAHDDDDDTNDDDRHEDYPGQYYSDREDYAFDTRERERGDD